MGTKRQVAVAGLGAVGMKVARALDAGLDGLELVAVSAADPDRARARVAGFARVPQVLPVERLAERADIVVECLPPSLFRTLAEPALAAGRLLVVASAGALVAHDDLRARAGEGGGRVLLPSGALAGLDGLHAAAEAGLEAVTLVTRKPPGSLGGEAGEGAQCVFAGTAREAIARFPLNVNVAATVSLAGLGPDRTRVEVWSDPALTRNEHHLTVESRAGRFTLVAQNWPDPENPKSSAITGFSIIAALRRLTLPLVIGT
ncbi:MAG: aspartate dehydrogenase [Rhizobiales bacterium]|nr:aspartate dehydrogenase [Hyphomicrobiales bacterium]